MPKYFPPFPVVSVKTSARSATDAHHRGLDALDETHGIINFVANRTVQVRVSSGPSQPVNQLRLGPLQTIHDQDGHIATPGFWYETDFVQPIRLVSLGKDAATVRQLLRLCRRNYGQPLVSHGRVGLLRYVRALDLRD